jgi:hypothetical protein
MWSGSQTHWRRYSYYFCPMVPYATILGVTMTHTSDTSLLEAALIGYQAELARINAAIGDLKKRMGKRRGAGLRGPFTKAPAAHKPHRISPEGLARIVEGQRKRWAAARKKAQ